jgi:biopolymer transport protein ExbD
MGFKTLSHSESHSESETDSSIFAEINITPLTDIFLVLLIIFMVTSSVMAQMGVNVNLPQASQATAQSQPEKLLKAAFSHTSSRLVILEGDRQAFLGSAIEVMDHARKAGAASFAIATTEKT